MDEQKKQALNQVPKASFELIITRILPDDFQIFDISNLISIIFHV